MGHASARSAILITVFCSAFTSCLDDSTRRTPDGSAATAAVRQPKLTAAEAIRIANAAAREDGYDLARFEAPEARYDRSDIDGQWWVHYTGKVRRPGNHFSVRVDDKTTETHVFAGR